MFESMKNIIFWLTLLSKTKKSVARITYAMFEEFFQYNLQRPRTFNDL